MYCYTSADIFPTFVPCKRCRTTTYQKSFFIRSTRIWNLFTGRIDLANATLTSFKSLLYGFYSRAVRMNYNPDNPRSFKTICLKCNSIRFLDVEVMCCMLSVFWARSNWLRSCCDDSAKRLYIVCNVFFLVSLRQS